MLRLRGILNEFDYGKRLLDDPTNWAGGLYSDKFSTDKHRALDIQGEPDTEDEALFVQDLITYLKDQDKADPGKILPVLKKLVPLKSKFPKILDPRSGITGDVIYRGATIPFSIFDRNIPARTKIIRGEDGGSIGTVAALNINTTMRPRARRGFYSFSGEYERAENFAVRAAHKTEQRETLLELRMPCIVATSVDDAKCIFNPAYIDAVGPYYEYEVLYIGDNIKISAIYIPKWVLRVVISNIYGYIRDVGGEDNAEPEIIKMLTKLLDIASTVFHEMREFELRSGFW